MDNRLRSALLAALVLPFPGMALVGLCTIPLRRKLLERKRVAVAES